MKCDQDEEILNRLNRRQRHRKRRKIIEEQNFENNEHRINFHNNGARNQRDTRNNRG